MKLFKTKEEKISEEFTKYLKSMNFDAPNQQCEEIDEKLDLIYKSLDYDDYIEFIYGNEYVKLYDNIMGKYANNVTLSKELVNSIPNDLYIEVNKIIDEKLKEIKKEG